MPPHQPLCPPLRGTAAPAAVSGFGFRVSGFGSQVSGLESCVSGLGFQVSSFGSRVSGLGFRVTGFGSQVSGFGSRVSSLGFRVTSFEKKKNLAGVSPVGGASNVLPMHQSNTRLCLAFHLFRGDRLCMIGIVPILNPKSKNTLSSLSIHVSSSTWQAYSRVGGLGFATRWSSRVSLPQI